MAQRSIQGSTELATKMRLRRDELHLTIEEAASRSGVGTKTWSRYEAGESIRLDKVKGICKALNWRSFPGTETNAKKKNATDEYRQHEAWSPYLEETFGSRAAIAFATGSDILLDDIRQDLSDLASMPFGSHIGQLDASFISDALPPQFLMKYDYVFLYHMKCILIQLRWKAKHGLPMIAHSIMEELLIYLCNEESKALIDVDEDTIDNLETNDEDQSENWVFDLLGDMDIITYLYSDIFLDEDHPFYFTKWSD